MRFEGKHKVFKIIIRHTHNYKKCFENIGRETPKHDGIPFVIATIFQATSTDFKSGVSLC